MWQLTEHSARASRTTPNTARELHPSSPTAAAKQGLLLCRLDLVNAPHSTPLSEKDEGALEFALSRFFFVPSTSTLTWTTSVDIVSVYVTHRGAGLYAIYTTGGQN